MATVTNQSFLRRHSAPRQAPPRSPRGLRKGRTEVCPPPPPRPHWWVLLYHWLKDTSLHEAVSGFWSGGRSRVPPDALFEAARHEFFDAIALAETIDRSRSRQELWHLRAEVFALVSEFRDQTEAEERLARLNRFFPTRAPGSGFASLEHPR